MTARIYEMSIIGADGVSPKLKLAIFNLPDGFVPLNVNFEGEVAGGAVHGDGQKFTQVAAAGGMFICSPDNVARHLSRTKDDGSPAPLEEFDDYSNEAINIAKGLTWWDACKDGFKPKLGILPGTAKKAFNDCLKFLGEGPPPGGAQDQEWTAGWDKQLEYLIDTYNAAHSIVEVDVVFERNGVSDHQMTQWMYTYDCGLGFDRVAAGYSDNEAFNAMTPAAAADCASGSGDPLHRFPKEKCLIVFRPSYMMGTGFPDMGWTALTPDTDENGLGLVHGAPADGFIYSVGAFKTGDEPGKPSGLCSGCEEPEGGNWCVALAQSNTRKNTAFNTLPDALPPGFPISGAGGIISDLAAQCVQRQMAKALGDAMQSGVTKTITMTQSLCDTSEEFFEYVFNNTKLPHAPLTHYVNNLNLTPGKMKKNNPLYVGQLTCDHVVHARATMNGLTSALTSGGGKVNKGQIYEKSTEPGAQLTIQLSVEKRRIERILTQQKMRLISGGLAHDLSEGFEYLSFSRGKVRRSEILKKNTLQPAPLEAANKILDYIEKTATAGQKTCDELQSDIIQFQILVATVAQTQNEIQTEFTNLKSKISTKLSRYLLSEFLVLRPPILLPGNVRPTKRTGSVIKIPPPDSHEEMVARGVNFIGNLKDLVAGYMNICGARNFDPDDQGGGDGKRLDREEGGEYRVEQARESTQKYTKLAHQIDEYRLNQANAKAEFDAAGPQVEVDEVIHGDVHQADAIGAAVAGQEEEEGAGYQQFMPNEMFLINYIIISNNTAHHRPQLQPMDPNPFVGLLGDFAQFFLCVKYCEAVNYLKRNVSKIGLENKSDRSEKCSYARLLDAVDGVESKETVDLLLQGAHLDYLEEGKEEIRVTDHGYVDPPEGEELEELEKLLVMAALESASPEELERLGGVPAEVKDVKVLAASFRKIAQDAKVATNELQKYITRYAAFEPFYNYLALYIEINRSSAEVPEPLPLLVLAERDARSMNAAPPEWRVAGGLQIQELLIRGSQELKDAEESESLAIEVPSEPEGPDLTYVAANYISMYLTGTELPIASFVRGAVEGGGRLNHKTPKYSKKKSIRKKKRKTNKKSKKKIIKKSPKYSKRKSIKKKSFKKGSRKKTLRKKSKRKSKK